MPDRDKIIMTAASNLMGAISRGHEAFVYLMPADGYAPGAPPEIFVGAKVDNPKAKQILPAGAENDWSKIPSTDIVRLLTEALEGEDIEPAPAAANVDAARPTSPEMPARPAPAPSPRNRG